MAKKAPAADSTSTPLSPALLRAQVGFIVRSGQTVLTGDGNGGFVMQQGGAWVPCELSEEDLAADWSEE